MIAFDRQAWWVACGYLGAVVGAGFASGQEIIQFFVVYDKWGLCGTLISGALFAVMGYLLFMVCYRERLNSYQGVLKTVFGARWGKLVDAFFSLFLFLGVCVMFAASGAVFYEHLNISKTLGIMVSCSLVTLLLIGGVKGLVLSYNLLVPVKILILLSVAGWGAFGLASCDEIQVVHKALLGHGHWALASILYVAYNFALATVLLSEYQSMVDIGSGVLGVVIGGLGLGFMLFIYYLALSNSGPMVLNYEVPMLLVAGRVGIGAKVAYICVLWIGILTTALANGYGLAQRISELTGMRYISSLCLVIICSLPLSFLSFSCLVGAIYPLLGFLGIPIMLGVLVHYLRLLTTGHSKPEQV